MLTFALALLLDPPAIAPPERPSLVVQIDRGDEACVDVDLPRLHEAVELALGWSLEHRQAAPAQAWDTEVTIACIAEGEPRVELAIRDPQTGTIASRILDAPSSDDPERRAEVLALAVADLVRTTWHALEQEAPAALEPSDPDLTSARTRRRARAIARRPTAPYLAGDGFVVRTYFGDAAPTLMLGEQVELVHRPLRNLAWKIDGELAAWRVPAELGDLKTMTLSVAPALLGYGEFGGSSRPGRPGRVAIYGGMGARIGGVRTLGEGSASASFRPIAGPLATARIELVCGRFVRVALVGETGWLLAGPVDPQGLTMRGGWANGTFVIVSAF
ncbi:hypothetical protein ACNOYE_12125 [Nannocystaceae bacterium ST9]